MTNYLSGRYTASGRIRIALATLVGALALVFASTMPASAANLITSPTSGAVVTSSPLTVTGVADAGVDLVVVTWCEYGSGGTECASSYVSATISGTSWVASLPVVTSFAGYDYTGGFPPVATGNTVDCFSDGGADDCAVFASFYDFQSPSPHRGSAEVLVEIAL